MPLHSPSCFLLSLVQIMLYFSEPYNISCALCHPLPEMYGFRPEMQRWNTGVSMAGRTQWQPNLLLQFISRLARFLCWLPSVIVHKKIKTYISEKQNYNSSAAQKVYYMHISQPTIRKRYAEQTCNFFRGNICLYFLLV